MLNMFTFVYIAIIVILVIEDANGNNLTLECLIGEGWCVSQVHVQKLNSTNDRVIVYFCVKNNTRYSMKYEYYYKIRVNITTNILVDHNVIIDSNGIVICKSNDSNLDFSTVDYNSNLDISTVDYNSYVNISTVDYNSYINISTVTKSKKKMYSITTDINNFSVSNIQHTKYLYLLIGILILVIILLSISRMYYVFKSLRKKKVCSNNSKSIYEELIYQNSFANSQYVSNNSKYYYISDKSILQFNEYEIPIDQRQNEYEIPHSSKGILQFNEYEIPIDQNEYEEIK